MSILNRIFKRSFQRSLAEMYSQTDVIQMAIAVKLLNSYERRFQRDDAATIAAAVSNRLFAKSYAQHSEEELRQAEQLANRNITIRFRSSLCRCNVVQARLLFEAERHSEERSQIWDTIQWMSTVCELPPDEADPASVRQLATTLHRKYLKKN